MIQVVIVISVLDKFKISPFACNVLQTDPNAY